MTPIATAMLEIVISAMFLSLFLGSVGTTVAMGSYLIGPSDFPSCSMGTHPTIQLIITSKPHRRV